MKASERLDPGAVAQLQKSIQDAHGNEVFAVAVVDEDGIVKQIKIAARGDERSVPVLEPHIGKGDAVIHNHPSGLLSPSSADLMIASRLGNNGVGFYIVDNQVENIYVAAEPIRVKKTNIPIDIEELAAILSPGGGLSRIFPGYETRNSQINMLKLVCRALNEKKICIAEGGTGVGKSLAYLLPAVAWIVNNDERFVISTGTINLQHQLMEKDIPLVKSLLKANIKAVLVKGRGNYVCFTRLNEALADKGLFPAENEVLQKIFEWSNNSSTGCISDLSFLPPDEVWASVRSESDICLGLRCPLRENCFVLKARKEAATAQLLVVNHHLLFSDLEVRVDGKGFETTAVLPPFQQIIFDEAHNIENSATSFFTQMFSRASINKAANRLYFTKGPFKNGVFCRLAERFANNDFLNQMPDLIMEIKDAAQHLESKTEGILALQNNLFLNDPAAGSNSLALLEDSLFETEKAIIKLCDAFEDFLKFLSDEENEELVVYEAIMQVKRMKNTAQLCGRFRDMKKEEGFVFWIEKSQGFRGRSSMRFTITPLDITAMMQTALYEPFNSVIFTSATLAVNNDFEFWKKRVGISCEVLQAVFPSPFDYKNNVLLGLPVDAPMPDNPGFQDYVSAFIKKALVISGGRSLVLFTSYAMLNRTYADIRDELAASHIVIYKQGDDDKSRLLNRFKDEISSVLFATDSFWEGIDTPGKTLELLIITKLPFKVPTDPVIKARMDDITSKGGNSFNDYSMPEAVIKLKQGFGRLMRRDSDKGIVVILDSRIIHKSYGKVFLNSLPQTRVAASPGEKVFGVMRNFITAIRQDE